MRYTSIITYIVNLCTGLRLSQRKTLGELVLGAMNCGRASLAGIGRSVTTNALAKHSIKRVYRFLKNERIDVAEGCRGPMQVVSKASGGRLFVALD